MKLYSHYGFHEFIICAGYKQHIIKEYFANYYLHNADLTFDLSTNQIQVHTPHAEPWKITVVDTGLNTMTGGRIKRICNYVGDESFLLTYGDGVSDVDIRKLVEFHEAERKFCTMTAVRPEGRFGILDINGNEVRAFREKNKEDVGYINGGFMVCEPQVFDYIQGDDTIFERQPLERLAAERQLAAFKHDGFWQCMDTVRDKQNLEKLWAEKNAPWRVWEN